MSLYVFLIIICGQVEIKRTIPKGSAESKDFKTKKIFVGGIPAVVTEGLHVELFELSKSSKNLVFISYDCVGSDCFSISVQMSSKISFQSMDK